MKKLIRYLVVAAALLIGATAAQADSRVVIVDDSPAWSRDHDSSSYPGRTGRRFHRNRDDSDRWDRGRQRHFEGHRQDHRTWRRGHDKWQQPHRRWRRDDHFYWRNDDYRHWRGGRHEHWYPRSYWHDDGYRYWRGSRYVDDRLGADLQLVVTVPLW